MVGRKEKRTRRQTDAIATKLENRPVKEAERARRDLRMVAKLKSGKPPFAPAVMSWLSRKLDKRASLVTAKDIRGLVG